jgi:hypothetical protein
MKPHSGATEKKEAAGARAGVARAFWLRFAFLATSIGPRHGWLVTGTCR